jgi:N-dimethylarginine dimethylaminohydrolase
MPLTHHSEYGPLKSVFLKRLADAFVNEDHITAHWKDLNFLDKPNMVRAEKEHHYFESLIRSTGADVKYFPFDPTVTMDSLYCRDASIATDYGMIICNMGKPQRKPETQASMNAYLEKALPILGSIQAPGTLEGGDVAWVDQQTLAVGRTYRTNDAGILQLKAMLEPHGITVWVADMPHYKGPSDVFHLMSVFSPVDKNLAVVYSPLMPITFREGLLARGYTLVEVPDHEWDSMGCNVLALAPRMCLMVEGNPVTRHRLEQHGCTVQEYVGTEISVKGGGGPTCLTRPLLRKINMNE